MLGLNFELGIWLNFVDTATGGYYLQCSERKFTALRSMLRREFFNCLYKEIPRGKRPHSRSSNFGKDNLKLLQTTLVIMKNTGLWLSVQGK